jgi:O-methyltransferase
LEGTFPDDTAHLIQENTFRFCHIDVDVYQSAKEISDWIWEKMSIGGVIVYDDYGFPSCDGITKFVEEQHQNPDRIILHNLNGHAVVIKIR